MLFKNTDKFFYPTPLGVDTGGEVEGEEREFYKTDLYQCVRYLRSGFKAF